MNVFTLLLLLISFQENIGKILENVCKRPSSGESYTVSNEQLCALTCKSQFGCAAFFYNDEFNNGKDNCILKTRYEINFLGQEFYENYDLYHCYRGKSKTGKDFEAFIKLPAFNVSEEAKELGFNLTMDLEYTTKFIKELEGPIEFWKAQRLCAESNGILVMEHDNDIAQALISLGAPIDKRHNGLYKLDSTKELVWEDGYVEWKKDGYLGIESCSPYMEWTDEEWENENLTSIFADQNGNLHLNVQTDLASKAYCEYVGPNVALNKVVITDSHIHNGRNPQWVVDNYWNTGGYQELLFYAAYFTNAHDTWICIDLQSVYYIRMFRMASFLTLFGDLHKTMSFIVGNVRPTEEQGLDLNAYETCDYFESPLNREASPILTVTCQCLVKGRFAIYHRNYKQNMHFNEIAVYGFKEER